MSAKMNVPELRFKEFSGEWEERKLANISLRTAKKNRENDINSVFTNSATDGIVNQRDYFDKDIANQNNLEGYYIVETDNFIYNPRISTFAPVGPLNRNHLGCGVMSPLYTVFSIVDKNVNLDFIERYFRTKKWHRYMCNIANYGARSDRMNITNSDLFKMPIPLPQKPEQEKIASFLSSVDTKIEQLTKKKTLLDQYKKGVMQKIFSKEIRFRDDDGGEYPEWVERKLGEVTEIIMGQSPESNSYNLDEIGQPLIQGNADIQNRLSNPRNWTTQTTKECKVGDLILTVRAPVGAVAKSVHNACIGRGVCAIRNNSTSKIEFLFQFLLDFESKWGNLEQGSTFTAVSGNEIKKLKIHMPTLKEQTKIANFLSVLDSKISQVGQQLEAAKQFKKALLQKMFV